MRHLTISEYGQFLGCTGERLQVMESGQTILETPLSRLRTITITKPGVSLSSNVIMACASRGIKLFFHDWKGIAVAGLSGQHQHAVAEIRKAQFAFLETPQTAELSAQIILGKLKNQRSVLKYFGKYKNLSTETVAAFEKSISQIDQHIDTLKRFNWPHRKDWRYEILGYEGAAATAYWQAIKSTGLFPESFTRREGRGALEITNQSLNYGYAILTSYIWSALENAGLELYAGVLHQPRAGKPSLVLDLMEEYRAWVVDREVIKLRFKLNKAEKITPQLKKELAQSIQNTLQKKYSYKGKRLKLETILQRQAYRLAGTFSEHKPYKSFSFKW